MKQALAYPETVNGREDSERCRDCGHFPDECGCTCCWPALPAPSVVTDKRTVEEFFSDIARQNPEVVFA